MASRALVSPTGGRNAKGADWRAILRRSFRRSAELIGAALLFAAMVALGLALASYTQTDPSGSTASGSPVENWMGLPGAWAAERVLLFFGLPGVLLLPLLYVFARRLWDAAGDLIDIDEEDEGFAPLPAWWRLALLLALAMALMGTAFALMLTAPGGTLPAGAGGISGLIGAAAIRGAANWLPGAELWIVRGAALVTAVAGLVVTAQVFAFDWHRLPRLPRLLRRSDRPVSEAAAGVAALLPKRQPKVRAEAGDAETAPAAPEAPSARRRPTEITDPSRPPSPAQIGAKARQGDLFDEFELPGLDILDPLPVVTGPKIDKLALERNARLLENVLDDFNVKGEITAVRTGPVVTMYELEPAPGIKASRVIGLADDIARNMSAISARVSSIPGRTVMGIELPNAVRDMVSFHELVSCDKFVNSKGMLPIILGKDIAGEPIVADLATMPHLLVAGTTGSGKSVGLNCILLSLLYRLTPQQCRLILVDPKVLELKSYDDIPH